MTKKEIEKAVDDYIANDLFNKLPPPPRGQITIGKQGLVVMCFDDFVRLVEADSFDAEYIDRIKNMVGELKRMKG